MPQMPVLDRSEPVQPDDRMSNASVWPTRTLHTGCPSSGGGGVRNAA